MCNDADVANQCTLEQLYNSYDNTILYVDLVLGEIIQRLDRSGVPYVFIYRVRPRRIADGGRQAVPRHAAGHRPCPRSRRRSRLIVKSSIPVSIVKRAEYDQPDMFDTVLDLFSIQTTTFDNSGSFIKKQVRAGPIGSRNEPRQRAIRKLAEF